MHAVSRFMIQYLTDSTALLAVLSRESKLAKCWNLLIESDKKFKINFIRIMLFKVKESNGDLLIRTVGLTAQPSFNGDLLEKLASCTNQELLEQRICKLEKLADVFSLQGSTKYMAIHVFIFTFLNSQDSNLLWLLSPPSLLELVSLQLAIKLNESSQIQLLNYDQLAISESQIDEFESQILAALNFEGSFMSPYHWLKAVQLYKMIPEPFSRVVEAFIDFCISNVQFLIYQPEQIFTGCLIACRNSTGLRNSDIDLLIGNLVLRIQNAECLGLKITEKMNLIIQGHLGQ